METDQETPETPARGRPRGFLGRQAQAPRSLRPQGDDHPGPERHGQGAPGRGCRGDEEARPHLQDPPEPDREERAPLRGGRARDPARRLWLPPRSRVELPAGSGRHLRLSLADPQVRPAHRGHGERPGTPAQGGRALLRPHQGGGHQLRAPGSGQGQGPLRQPDAALPERAAPAGERTREPDRAGPRHDDSHRQGSARPHRGRPPHGQDHDPAEHGELDRGQPPRGHPHRPAHRRAARGGDGHAARR